MTANWAPWRSIAARSPGERQEENTEDEEQVRPRCMMANCRPLIDSVNTLIRCPSTIATRPAANNEL